MVENVTILASESENRSTTETWLAANLEWHFPSPAKWLFLADVAQRFATLKTVYQYFRVWQQDDTWERLNRLLREKCDCNVERSGN